MEQKRENWGSRFGFIMAAAGFAIGLGNIWRFPYLVGQNGGGIFLFLYLLACLIIGIPLFNMEMSLGRKSKMNPVLGMRALTKKGSPWVLIGWIGVLAAFFVLTYYIQIMGWILYYLISAITGKLNSAAMAESSDYALFFDSLMGNPGMLILMTVLCSLIIAFISYRGLQSGIESSCKIMMPALFIMLIVLAIRSLTLPGAMEGLKWYLGMDFSAVKPQTFLTVISQVFFSIGISSGGAFIYGSYLADDSDIPADSLIIVFFDMGIAVIIGLVIFPAIFALGLSPDSGASLLFITMSNLFSKIPFGQVFSILFFLLVFFAALSSALGFLESVAITVKELFGISRPKAVVGSLVLINIIGIGPIMAQGPWNDLKILGRNLFDLADFFSGSILMPAGAILIALYVSRVWSFDDFQKETNAGTKGFKIFNWWRPLVNYVIPAVLLVILISEFFQ